MSAPYDYDLIVIGSGPAGEKGAAQAAFFGRKVALVERAPQPRGGAGLNTGTVPSKTLRETALYFSGLRQRGLYGIDYALKEGLNIGDFMYRKQMVVESEWGIIQRSLERHNIDVIWGSASLQNAHTVRIHRTDGGAADLSAAVILIATGSSPVHPPEVSFDNQRMYDSETILNLDAIPRNLTIIGGGVIGAEYASIFTALGVAVTVVDTGERLLPFVDGEIADRLRRRLEELGAQFIFNSRVQQVEAQAEHARLRLENGRELTTEIVLFAAGRQSNVEGLGLEKAGVAVGKRGLIQVNENYQTTVPNIYAAGDVIGFPALASAAMEQARQAMTHAFNLLYKERPAAVLPVAVYTIPEISMIGLSEENCRAKGLPYLVGRASYAKSPRGQIIGDTHGMIKLIFSPTNRKLLGVHIIGEIASELIHLGAHVLAEGGVIDVFINAVYNYPSLSDSYKYAAYDGLGKWEKATQR